MKNYSISKFIFILTPFVFSFAFGLDIYIPVVPQMADIFTTTPRMIQLTLSLFLLTTGVAQLLIGPLSDQYGRKVIFYVSSLIFVLGSLGCAFSNHIIELLVFRTITALGACGMLVTSFAIVRDLFSNEESAKMFSFLNGAIGISPTFAPILGGYLAHYFGWQSNFLFLSLIGLFAFVVTKLFIKETHPRHVRVNMDRALFQRYWMILRNKQFMAYSLLAGLAEGIFFCFFSISPFIIIDKLNVPLYQFGYYFAVFGSVISLGGFASGKFIEKVGIRKTIAIGISMMFIGGLSMLIWYAFASLTLSGFLIPMAIACTGAMFLVGSSASGALQPFGKIAGTASAAFGFIEFAVPSIAGSLLMLFSTDSTIPYGITIVIIATLSLKLFTMTQESTLTDPIQS